MTKKKTVFIAILLVILGGVGYFVWQNRHNYFFGGEETFNVEDEIEMEMYSEENEIIDKEADKILEAQGELEVEIEERENEKTTHKELDELELSSDDNEYESPVVETMNCDNECEDFDDEYEFAYCEEICGFAEDDLDRKSEDCEQFEKFERDACYKQEAVDEKNINICKKIFDGVLKENCENRVTEEILDQQNL